MVPPLIVQDTLDLESHIAKPKKTSTSSMTSDNFREGSSVFQNRGGQSHPSELSNRRSRSNVRIFCLEVPPPRLHQIRACTCTLLGICGSPTASRGGSCSGRGLTGLSELWSAWVLGIWGFPKMGVPFLGEIKKERNKNNQDSRIFGYIWAYIWLVVRMSALDIIWVA